MKMIIGAPAIVLSMMICAPTVYAETAYQSGFKHGVADATADNAPDCNDPKVSHPKCKDDYIDQPGKGLFFHSKQFVNGYVKGWCSVMGPNAGTERVSAIFDCDKDPSSAGWATNSKGQNPISEGIVIEASGVPPGGINLLYSYIDHTSGTRGTDQVNATQNGQSHMMGFSSDVDNGYYPGDKVTVSVSKYVPKGDIPYGTIDANGNASYIPQPIIDSKTVTLGETGAVIDLSTWNAWPHNPSYP